MLDQVPHVAADAVAAATALKQALGDLEQLEAVASVIQRLYSAIAGAAGAGAPGPPGSPLPATSATAATAITVLDDALLSSASWFGGRGSSSSSGMGGEIGRRHSIEAASSQRGMRGQGPSSTAEGRVLLQSRPSIVLARMERERAAASAREIQRSSHDSTPRNGGNASGSTTPDGVIVGSAPANGGGDLGQLRQLARMLSRRGDSQQNGGAVGEQGGQPPQL